MLLNTCQNKPRTAMPLCTCAPSARAPTRAHHKSGEAAVEQGRKGAQGSQVHGHWRIWVAGHLHWPWQPWPPCSPLPWPLLLLLWAWSFVAGHGACFTVSMNGFNAPAAFFALSSSSFELLLSTNALLSHTDVHTQSKRWIEVDREAKKGGEGKRGG